MTQEQKAEALYPIEIETPTQGISFDVNEDERNAYIQGYQDGQEAYREAAGAIHKALKGLCEYWEWSIKDPAFREYAIAKQAIDNYEKLNK